MKLFNKTDYLKWIECNDFNRKLSTADYELLYDYLVARGFALCQDSEHCLYRIDVDSDGISLYSVDELIRDVTLWNSSIIREYDISLKLFHIKNQDEIAIKDVLEKLKYDEIILEKAFRTTKFGRLIGNACRKITEEGDVV